MNNTFDKFLEAKYFLKCMVESEADRMPFKYNLSAFLTAFRSVTFFMQKEYSKIDGFIEWYLDKQKKLESDEKMQLLNKKRVMTIHKVPVGLHAQINVSIHESVFATDEVSVEIIHADGTIEKEDPKTIERIEPPTEIAMPDKWLWFFDDYPNSDVVSICNECTDNLSNIISECNSTFPLT
jgi:hypothetical protein